MRFVIYLKNKHFDLFKQDVSYVSKTSVFFYCYRMIRFSLVMLFFASLMGSQADSREIWIADTNSCNKLPTTIAIVECINQKTKIWDLRLNQSWAILTNMLKDPTMQDQYKTLVEAQRLWLKYRDANCHFYDTEQGTISQIDGAECMRRMTQDRAIELQLAGPQA